MQPGKEGFIIFDDLHEVDVAHVALYRANGKKGGVRPKATIEASAALGDYDFPQVPVEIPFSQAAAILVAARWIRDNPNRSLIPPRTEIVDTHRDNLIAGLETYLPPEAVSATTA